MELPKFSKSLSELETLTDKWIYFIKSAKSFGDSAGNNGESAGNTESFGSCLAEGVLPRQPVADKNKRCPLVRMA